MQWFGALHIWHNTRAAETIECFSNTVFTFCFFVARVVDITSILKWITFLAKIGQISTVTHVIITSSTPLLAFIRRRNICKRANFVVPVFLTLDISASFTDLYIFYRTASIIGQCMSKWSDCKQNKEHMHLSATKNLLN